MRVFLQQLTDQQIVRYFDLRLQPDLFGGWNLVEQWGGPGRSGSRRHHFETLDAAQRALEDARERQVDRGFTVMFRRGLSA